MNWLDIVLLILIGSSTIAGLLKGLSRQIIGLTSALVALFCATMFYGSAGAFLLPYLSSKGVANFCGFVLVFCGVLLVGAAVSHFVGRLLKLAGLSWFDRVLGAGFGVVRGLLLAIAVVMVITAFAPGASANSPPSAIVQSRIAPYVIDIARVFTGLAPKELKDGFRKHYEQVKTIWERAMKQED